MSFLISQGRMLAMVTVCAAAMACTPSRDGNVSELKDPHFLRGQELAQQLNHKGAIESFEKALEANPRSSAAHFELGFLYQDEKKGGDPTAAIYHFERFQRLRPTSQYSDVIKRHIRECKIELARSENLVAATPATQRDFDRFKADLERLAAENAQLRLKLEQTGHAAPAPAPTTAPAASPATAPAPKTPPPPTAPARGDTVVAATKSRSHTIRQGENPGIVAKQYRVKLDSLLTANPGIDPKRLKIGQVLAIPTE